MWNKDSIIIKWLFWITTIFKDVFLHWVSMKSIFCAEYTSNEFIEVKKLFAMKINHSEKEKFIALSMLAWFFLFLSLKWKMKKLLGFSFYINNRKFWSISSEFELEGKSSILEVWAIIVPNHQGRRNRFCLGGSRNNKKNDILWIFKNFTL